MNRITRYIITDAPHRRATMSVHEAAAASDDGARVTAVTTADP